MLRLTFALYALTALTLLSDTAWAQRPDGPRRLKVPAIARR